MEFLIKLFTWFAANYEMIGQSIMVILAAAGVIFETLNKIFGKGEDSALSKVGKAIVKIGEMVKKVLDFFKPKPKV